MKLTSPKTQSAFTLIELLVVISIIAILAGIALPVFGEVQIRGAQTKALSNAKQVGLACKVFAQDYNGDYPRFTDLDNKTGTPSDANAALQVLIPDYIPEKSVFSIPKSAYTKSKNTGGSGNQNRLQAGDNEWAYVMGLSDTSNARFPLLADGFATGTEKGSPSYVIDENKPGGVWKGKKAVVIRCDGSGTVETCRSASHTVPFSDTERTKNLFTVDGAATPPWLTGATVLNPLAP